jgi:hypothetical protein
MNVEMMHIVSRRAAAIWKTSLSLLLYVFLTVKLPAILNVTFKKNPASSAILATWEVNIRRIVVQELHR